MKDRPKKESREAIHPHYKMSIPNRVNTVTVVGFIRIGLFVGSVLVRSCPVAQLGWLLATLLLLHARQLDDEANPSAATANR